jgi:hypothetical protein
LRYSSSQIKFAPLSLFEYFEYFAVKFTATRLGGYSLVPVDSSSNPKARASRNKAGIQNQTPTTH